MRELLAGTFGVFFPILKTTGVQRWLETIDDNFFVFGSALTLFISLVLWANI
ncbi:MAG: hypothetical protein WC817_03560 [Patescibacteria group bacterium]|jgi:hypothetical protein